MNQFLDLGVLFVLLYILYLIVHPKILPSFTHPHVVPYLIGLLSSVEHQRWFFWGEISCLLFLIWWKQMKTRASLKKKKRKETNKCTITVPQQWSIWLIHCLHFSLLKPCMFCVTDKSFYLLIIFALCAMLFYYYIQYSITVFLIGFYLIFIYMVFSLRFGEFCHFHQFSFLKLFLFCFNVYIYIYNSALFQLPKV